MYPCSSSSRVPAAEVWKDHGQRVTCVARHCPQTMLLGRTSLPTVHTMLGSDLRDPFRHPAWWRVGTSHAFSAGRVRATCGAILDR